MRYKVTGGADGLSGIDMGGKRYEAGDTIEMSGAKAQWLVDKGLLEPEQKRTSAKADPADEEAIEEIAEVEEDVEAGDAGDEGDE